MPEIRPLNASPHASCQYVRTTVGSTRRVPRRDIIINEQITVIAKACASVVIVVVHQRWCTENVSLIMPRRAAVATQHNTLALLTTTMLLLLLLPQSLCCTLNSPCATYISLHATLCFRFVPQRDIPFNGQTGDDRRVSTVMMANARVAPLANNGGVLAMCVCVCVQHRGNNNNGLAPYTIRKHRKVAKFLFAVYMVFFGIWPVRCRLCSKVVSVV